MTTFLTIHSGRSVESAKPILASNDPQVLRAVMRALGARLPISSEARSQKAVKQQASESK